jgi:hypothetical protein
MKPPLSTSAFVTCILLAALGLAACGGGSSSSTSTTAPLAGQGASAQGGSVTVGKPRPRETATTRAERRQAGRAASFVAPESDNSVPTFGSEGSASERGQAEAALKSYLRARSREDWASACDQLARSVRQGYEKLAQGKHLGCATVLAALSKGADLSDPLTGGLLSLRVHGANGFALFYGPGHQQYMVPMNREGGGWRPTQAAAIAYPPGEAGGT